LAVGLLLFASAAFAAPTTPTADFTDNGDAQDHRADLDALHDGDEVGK